MDLTDREQRILGYIRSQVSQGRHPGNEQIAKAHGLAMQHVRRSLSIMIAKGALAITGNGLNRRFHLERFEPVRVLDSFPCRRCAAAPGRCGCYTTRLSSGRLPAYAVGV